MQNYAGRSEHRKLDFLEMVLLRYAAVSLEFDLNHTSDFFFFFFGETFFRKRCQIFLCYFSKKNKKKKELLYFSEVVAEDSMIAALKWQSGQVLEYMLATEKGMQDIGCH